MNPSAFRAACGAILAGMIAFFVWCGMQDNFLDALARIWSEPWGKGTLLDLYVGFMLVAGWIAWRERSIPKAAGWFVLLCGLGNLATLAYLLIASRGAHSVGDILGRRTA